MRFVWMGYEGSMCQNLNNLGVFWMNHVQMMQCCGYVISGRRVVCDIRSLVNTRVLKLEYARVCLLLCMVVRQYGRRERDLGLDLHR